MEKRIIRTPYLDRIRAGRNDTGIVKVITGMRRAGKSVIMEQYIEDLYASGVPEDDVLYIDFESLEGQTILTKDNLNAIIKEKVPKDRLFYVFFDEIQNVKDWEMSVSAINRMKNVDLYITGSNSEMLSSDLATHISGRHVEIEVFPLSFKEFMELHNYPDREIAMADYLKYGGLPAIDPSRGTRYARDYLIGVYSTVVIKDVIRRLKGMNPATVESISKFLYSNIGNTTNISSIASTTKLGNNTVDTYIDAMIDSFLFSMCQRYDMVGKKLLKTNGKYYAIDLGIRNAVLGITAGTDISRPLENIVYVELLRRGYDVRVGSYHDSEVDFIAISNNEVEYYQVCQTLMSEETRTRETRSLDRIHSNYQKTILTLDRFGLGNEDGIKIVNILDWLLS